MAQRTFAIHRDVSDVFEKLTDPDFIVARSKSMGEIDASCEVEHSDGRTSLQIYRTIIHEADKLPKLIRRFGLKQTVAIEEEWWDQGDAKAGRFEARPGNLPVQLLADITIEPSDDGSVLSITQYCKVNIPLIGAALEPLMLEQRQKDLDQEVEFLLQELA